LCDLTLERYEVREKKISKKVPFINPLILLYNSNSFFLISFWVFTVRKSATELVSQNFSSSIGDQRGNQSFTYNKLVICI